MYLFSFYLCPTFWDSMTPLSVEFSSQEYWSGLLFPSPEDLPDPGIEPGSPMLQTDSLPTEPLGKPIYLSDQISHSVVSDSLQPHELQYARPPCPSPTHGVQ